MKKIRRITTIALTDELHKKMDELVNEGLFVSHSDLVRHAVVELLIRLGKLDENDNYVYEEDG